MILSVRNAVIAVLSLVFLVAGAAPATAHSGVVGSSPENGAQVDTSPGIVSVTFNEALRTEYATLRVVGPDNHFWDRGEPTITGATISVPVGALGPAGQYLVNFRVTSADGHPVQGQRSFTLTAAGNGEPGAQASTADRTDPSDGTGFPVWVIVMLVVIGLLALGGLVAVLLRRRGA